MKRAKSMAWMIVIALGLISDVALQAQEAIPVSRPKNQERLRIGMMQNMFTGVPKSLISGVSKPFEQLLTSYTGMNGSMDMHTDAFEMARQINRGELELGVFHGYEFAWIKEKHPDLEPLVVAVPLYRKTSACLVVAKGSPVTCLSDLNGKNLALPNGIKEFARLYFERGCVCDSGPLKFTKVTNPISTEDALDDVIDGIVDGTVVDAPALQSFANRKRGRFNRLKIACESENFPLTVIVCRKGHMSEANMARIRSGLTQAQNSVQGRTMMGMWKLAGFEPIPADYDAQLIKTARLYPAPSVSK